MKKALLCIALLSAICAMGVNPPDIHAGQEGWKEISAPEVKSMIESGNAVVVHVLSEIEYNMQHISDSINIPIIDVKTSDRLPPDRDTPLVFYCMGKR